MRLNAINPADNPMEELLYCFGGDGGGDDSGGDSIDDISADFDNMSDQLDAGETVTSGMSGGVGRGGSSNDNDGDGIPNSIDRTVGVDRSNFGMQGATGDYVSQSISSFQSPSVGVMATPMQAATGRAGFTAPSSPVGNGRSGSASIAPSIAPNLVNQPLSVGGAFSMPYDSYQRSPQQMFGYGGLTASPYSPNAISFAGGQAARSYDPLGGESLSVFDMGRSPQDYADRSFFDRAAEAVGGRFGAPFQEQRAGFFDPATGTFRDVGGTSTLEKTSENPLGDLFGNYVGSMFGSTVDTATYAPLIGGEEFQYSDVGGLLGLLSDGPQMVPMSEIEARAAEMGGGDGGDGGSRQPLIIPTEEEDEQTSGPTEFPPFRQREYEYTPFTSNFYTIPQRFRRF